MRQLLWKEWHEQRWKLGFGTVVLCTFAMIGLHARIIPDQSIIVGAGALGVLLLPILAAAGLIPAERGQGTLRTLLALPVAPWKVLACKAISGALLCAMPLFAAATISLLMAGGREISVTTLLGIYTRSALVGIGLFVWMFSLTAGSHNEGRAAALSVGILVCWLMATSALLATIHTRSGYGIPDSHPAIVLWTACPFVFVFTPQELSLGAGLGVQALIAAGLWLLAVRTMTTARVEDKP
jgi:hypothetical protein